MPKTVTYKGPSNLLGAVASGSSYVRYGPARAIWRVVDKLNDGSTATLSLEAADPHDVPIYSTVAELPMLDRGI